MDSGLGISTPMDEIKDLFRTSKKDSQLDSYLEKTFTTEETLMIATKIKILVRI